MGVPVQGEKKWHRQPKTLAGVVRSIFDSVRPPGCESTGSGSGGSGNRQWGCFGSHWRCYCGRPNRLTNVNTSVTRTTTTNSDGAYVFLNVVPGAYTMRASAPGFAAVTQPQTTLEVNQTATFDFHLKIGETPASVTVEATAAGVEASTAELGTVVATQQVTDLPLNGRNFTRTANHHPRRCQHQQRPERHGSRCWRRRVRRRCDRRGFVPLDQWRACPQQYVPAWTESTT